MTCPTEDQIIDLVLDQLTEEETVFVRSHVAACEICRQIMNRYEDLSNHLAEEMPKLTPQDLAEIEGKQEPSLRPARQVVLANIREAVKGLKREK